MAYVCTLCGSSEEDCKCPRYCTLCKLESGVRLCEDGCYYCPDCREICGYTVNEVYRGGV